MELKKYQQYTITDLERFLEKIQELKDIDTAFNSYWTTHPLTPLKPFPGNAVEPYKNNIPGVPHICMKVPTAGGKTFIACNALKTIFDNFDRSKNKTVVWLVPSVTILDQTIKNLKDPHHGYRQKINSLFQHKVAVFDKAALLHGAGFNTSIVVEQLNIIVLGFDSLRARNKESRKVFQENGNLQSFGSLLDKNEDISVMNVLSMLNPVVIVDESHNAESELSVEMLINLNPCFVLDLTATPRNNSNIISFVDAIELKKENMVKLPVIVYNHHDKTEVISSALQLQHKLELQAKEEQNKGGKYIRPIVLFQAEPKNTQDSTTFEKLKQKLIELHIPAEHIKIKTAKINEIEKEDLLSPDCAVRYIITVNALKEGWDCPFAYILASLADKSSAVDVEQILGRVLRQPYVSKHQFPLLNLSFVLTASSRFLDTLGNIVKGLNKAGFSNKDYKLAEEQMPEEEKQKNNFEQLTSFTVEKADSATDDFSDIDNERITAPAVATVDSPAVSFIEDTAIRQTKDFDAMIAMAGKNNDILPPSELQSLVKTYPVKDIFKEGAAGILLPKFFWRTPANDLFGVREEEVLLDKENLLQGFQLSKADINIAFDSITSDLYKIDLDDTKKDHTPTFLKLDGNIKIDLMSYILDPSKKDARVKNMTRQLMGIIGKIDPVPLKDIEKYIIRILSDFTDDQFTDMSNTIFSYADKIKTKVRGLSEIYAEQHFRSFLDTDRILAKPFYSLPHSITPGEIAKDGLPKMLYEREGKLNLFEERVINEIGNLYNITFWTKNIEKKGFYINGFINHYPDFIIQTNSNKTVLLETKGDHLDAEQKDPSGEFMGRKIGQQQVQIFYGLRKRIVDGAYTLDDFLSIIKEL